MMLALCHPSPARSFIRAIIVLSCFLVCGKVQAQILPPYYQHFDSVNCTGWSHSALSGTDDWERGIPTGPLLNVAASGPNVWGTSLAGSTSANSVMVLQTPDFNLSSATKTFLLTFAHEYQTYSYHGGNVQYSTNQGVTWTLLNGSSTEKLGWYNNPSCSGLGGDPAWSNNQFSSYQYSTHSLAFLQGQASVRFRFQYGGSTNPQEGWQIDNFAVVENVPNVMAVPGITYKASKYFSTFDVGTSLVYNGLLPPPFPNTTNYYFSKDNILDAGDSLLGSKSQSVTNTIGNWSITFNMVPNLNQGDYYIIYHHDFLNGLAEVNETDNIGYCILRIDSTFKVPVYKEGFEDSVDYWKAYASPLHWVKGKSNIHQIEGPHTGKTSWYVKNLPSSAYATPPLQYLESPYLDLTPAPNNVMCFWYQSKRSSYSGGSALEFSTVNAPAIFSAPRLIPVTRKSGWDCRCENLAVFNGKNNLKIRIKYQSGNSYGMYYGNINVDDIYIGQPKPDLSIEKRDDLFTIPGYATDTLTFTLFNSGVALAGPSVAELYWSADSLLDASDQLVGTANLLALSDTLFRTEKIAYTKPTLALGRYYLFYKLDATGLLAEMREENNIGYYVLDQVPVTPVPYFNDFETQITGWSHSATIGKDDWLWGQPNGKILDTAFSGTKAWHTTGDTVLSPMSRQHLYTPIFDLSTMPNPVIEFDMKLHGDGSCHCFHSKMNMSYSVDGGCTWKVLDTTSQSYNRWYYPMDGGGGLDVVYYIPNYTYLMFEGDERSFANVQQYNSRDVSRNTRYVLDISFLSGQKKVQFRFNIAAHTYYQPMYANLEGALIDNFRISNKYTDLVVNYKKSLMISSINMNYKFIMDVKNQGNFRSNPSNIKFYLSSDTLLDAADFFLGMDTVKRTRPDMNYHLNEMLSGPPSLAAYKYLIHEIDPFNTNIESNETNNIGFWPLATDSVASYPYIQDFNDTIVDGWDSYIKNYNPGKHVKESFRFRNMLAPSEYIYSSGIVSGQMFTERINNVSSIGQVPFWHLETPSFDFSGLDSIRLSFDMLCIGGTSIGNVDGGNLQFSTDGGNTWTVLTAQYGNATNWYNYLNLNHLYGEPGWSGYGASLPRTFDLSFLQCQKHVVFRFQFRSNSTIASGSPQGMRIDNFKIEAYPLDYVANDVFTPVSALVSQPNVNFNYSITNQGPANGKPSATKFYWSNDSIPDAADTLVATVPEPPIASLQTITPPLSVPRPFLISQLVHYVFCRSDADTIMCELNEQNNLGSFKITFDSTNVSVGTLETDSPAIFVSGNNVYVLSQRGFDSENPFVLMLNNALGQNILSCEVQIQQGLNRFPLPGYIVPGLYLVNLRSDLHSWSKKAFCE